MKFNPGLLQGDTVNVQNFITNQVTRRLGQMFPRFMPTGSTKHDHYKDYGWPDDLTFDILFRMYIRNGLAQAAITKTVGKTWETNPELCESEDSKDTRETKLEKEIRRRFQDLRIWQKMAMADRKSLVGAYSGIILFVADGLPLNQPVGKVLGGLDGLRGILPVWEAQLTVGTTDIDTLSPHYGQPLMYQFNEAAVPGEKKTNKTRSVPIHPDRVIIWSEDGTLDCRSFLESGYNDLLDFEKVKGAGGEGFWKTSRGAPVLEAAEGVKLADLMKAMGVTEVTSMIDKVNEQLEDFQQGYDKGLMIGGMTAKPLQISLPSPEHFIAGPQQAFAASIDMPLKILVGNQTGERASTEDNIAWAKTNMSRRTNTCVPLIHLFIARLELFGILPDMDWYVEWADLTETSSSEKMARAKEMSDINSKTPDGDDFTFTVDEIRGVAGYGAIAELGLGDGLGEEDKPPSEEDEPLDGEDEEVTE